MTQKLPPRLAESLRRIEDYCKAIQQFCIKEHLIAIEAAELIEAEARKIVSDIQEERNG